MQAELKGSKSICKIQKNELREQWSREVQFDGQYNLVGFFRIDRVPTLISYFVLKKKRRPGSAI